MTEYIIPKWCMMPLDYHNDGMGGCWGISCGFVEAHGEDNCKTCKYYKPNPTGESRTGGKTMLHTTFAEAKEGLRLSFEGNMEERDAC